ncbi:MAG: MFS transporter [Actinoplanes sp.]
MSFTSSESRWGDVYLVAGARAVTVCGDFLAATTLALVLQQSGHGGFAVSGLLVAASLPLALLAPLTGRLADRADSRTVLVIAGFAQALVCLALAFVSHPVAIIALVALLACGLAVTQPTLSALLPGMVRRDDLARASGITQTAGQVGMLIAPALAGILVGLTGPRVPLLLDAVSYLALVVAGFALRTRRRGRPAGAAVAVARWRLRDDRLLLVMVGAITAVVAGVGAINVVEVFFVRETLGGSATAYGFVVASWTLGMLGGSQLFGRLRHDRITVPGVLLLSAGTCLPVLASAAVPGVGWIIPLWIAGGVCNGGINVFTTVLIADRVPAEVHGRAFAVLHASVQGGSLAGLLAAGPLVEHFEPRGLVAAMGVAGLLAAAACLPAVRTADVRTPAERASPERTPAEQTPAERVRPETPANPEQARDSVGA